VHKLLRRIQYWIRHRQNSQDLGDEIEFHRFLKQKDLERSGLLPDDAAIASRRTMGNTLVAMDDARRVWLTVWLEQGIQDLSYAVRSLSRSPGFILAAGLTIALGVGANTAVFSMFDAALLQLLPVEDPRALVFLKPAPGSGPLDAPPYPCLARLPSETGSFSGLAAFATDELRIEIDGKPEQVMGQVASGNYFELLGVKPALGRLMNIEDEHLNPAIAVISYRYWQRRFGRDTAVIGKTLSFGNQRFAIAGITPPELSGLEPGRPVDITLPVTTSRNLLTVRAWRFDAIARLKMAISETQAQAEANAVFQSCMSGSQAAAAPKPDFRHRLQLRAAAHGMDELRLRFSNPLYMLMSIAGLVLLMATANIACLFVVRSISRQREFAIRMATGAGRVRMIRQLLTETLVLFASGAVPGVLFARWGVKVIESLFGQGRRPITIEANFNWRVLAFSLVITLFAGLVAGLFPAWRAFRTEPEKAIKEGGARTGESGGAAKLMRFLVTTQIALSLVLLVGAVSFVGTLANLYNEDPGFANQEVLTMSIELPEGSVQMGKSIESWDRVLEGVRGLPGVRSAGLSTFTPLSGRDPGGTPVRIRGYEAAIVDDGSIRVDQVSEGYFETLGIPLLRGRLFTEDDSAGSIKVALINESAASKLFAGRDPIGQSLEFGKGGATSTVYQIVGVVANTKHKSLREPAAPLVFVPTRQPLNVERRVTLVVASSARNGLMTLVLPIRRRLTEVDSGLFVSEVITIQDQVDSTLLAERLLSGLSAVFGALSLLLAGTGLYGVLSYRIGQQRGSIGIRMALGASPSSVVFGVLRQSGLTIGVGLLCGLPFALLVVRTGDSMLWGVKSSSPMIYVTGTTLLCLIGFVSTYMPARRASAIEPAETLRHD
jgi:predicted permease